MAIIKKNELQNMSAEQMETKLGELRKELMRLNAQKSMGTSVENPGRIKAIKKTISKLIFKISNKEVKETQ